MGVKPDERGGHTISLRGHIHLAGSVTSRYTRRSQLPNLFIRDRPCHVRISLQ